MEIHQFVHTLHYGDAISGEALVIRRKLREMGIHSEIYSLHAHEKVKDIARDWQEFTADCDTAQAAGRSVAVVLHYSIASPLNDLFVSTSGILRAIIYHNLTPVHWFSRYNARVTADLIKGRDELPQLLEHVDVALADSSYNRDELLAMGCQQAEVLPLLIDEQKWQIEPNAGITSILRAHGGVNLLHVGRIAPNKCIEDIIKTFYFYHHKINEDSRLWLIGGEIDTEIYAFELRRLVTELRLSHAVSFVGSVSDTELCAFYQNADAYLCMSEHEGFCVPLLEAMHFKVPVIAYDAGAVRETLGDGGALIERKAPAELAELVDCILHDRQLRDRMTTQGAARVASFNEQRFEENLKQRLVAPISALAEQGAKPAVASGS